MGARSRQAVAYRLAGLRPPSLPQGQLCKEDFVDSLPAVLAQRGKRGFEVSPRGLEVAAQKRHWIATILGELDSPQEIPDALVGAANVGEVPAKIQERPELHRVRADGFAPTAQAGTNPVQGGV
jgi:hypothetical protein